MARIRVTARRSKPLRSVFQAYCRRLGLQESQVRFFCGELLSPDVTPDQLGLEDDHVIEAEEVYEEDDEAWVSFSRWVPAHADVLVVHVRSLCERTAPTSSWSRALTTSMALVPHPFVLDPLWVLLSASSLV